MLAEFSQTGTPFIHTELKGFRGSIDTLLEDIFSGLRVQFLVFSMYSWEFSTESPQILLEAFIEALYIQYSIRRYVCTSLTGTERVANG
jgi:hypothetical protein